MKQSRNFSLCLATLVGCGALMSIACGNLPYKLNKVLAGTSGDAAFTAVDNLLQQQTFGKNADTLWTQYQDTAF